MSNNAKTVGNKAIATLFVGVGGIGSKIIREVVDIAGRNNDDLTKARFVILDTDVGDLRRSEDGINITAIQTSSPRTIRDYLIQDKDAREEWFPNNMIINSKTVSEGAGQVRAISRLALNATIKTGRIRPLYQAIDDLYNKDGADKRQSIKIVIASTVAGGTGSGIAMIVGMLIRNYLEKNYPESSAVIRGYLMMPDVLNCFGPSASEENSLQRNGYATLKEINAFMMRPFFEAVPELNRYLDLHVDVPNAAGGLDRLTSSPFDFCFLFERTDASTAKMNSLAQYRSYMAHSIYEQSIGAMSAKASSKEDNIHKEFLDEKKLSRNRFGSAGASIVRYPYKEIRDYVAYEWIEEQIIGHSSGELSQDDINKLISESWLAYDTDYHNKFAEFQAGSLDDEPVRRDVYIVDVETGSEEFTKTLRKKFIDPKNLKHLNEIDEDAAADYGKESSEEDSKNGGAIIPAVAYYIDRMVEHVLGLYEAGENAVKKRATFEESKSSIATPGGVPSFTMRYNAIHNMVKYVNEDKIKQVAKGFVERSFNNPNKIDKKAEPFSIEAFLSLDGKALHPNAMRYLLYKLAAQLDKETESPEYTTNSFKAERENKEKGDLIKEGSSERDVKQFEVSGNFKKERSLQEMCQAIDGLAFGDSGSKKCNELLDEYAKFIFNYYTGMARYQVCQYAKMYVDRIIEQFERFYDSFRTKVTGLEKRKKTILTKIAFENGDCEYNLFNNPKHLQALTREQRRPTSGSPEEIELFAEIYRAIKENGKNKDILKSDAFADVAVVDVFEDVVVEQYKHIVEVNCPAIDVDVVRACGLECQIMAMCDAEINAADAEAIIKAGRSDKNKNAHLKKIINKGFALASPSLVRKSFEEDRSIESMAFNAQIEEGDGMKMPDQLFNREFASNTVPKNEMHFFRSIYGIMPTEIHKMSSPQVDPGKPDANATADEACEASMVGVYFSAYQDYMRKIGPDNRLNPVITPHIDKRWNAITVMPEIDPQGYQRVLMKRIHKAMIYGFIFERIEKNYTSPYDTKKFVYEYVDGRNGTKKLTVSNHTKCDRLFEVLDSLYFDRYAVHSIHEAADNIRNKEFEISTPYEKTTFTKYSKRINRSLLIDENDTLIADEGASACSVKTIGELAETIKDNRVSLLEIPMLYWRSLPKKDDSEIEIMVDAIYEMLYTEISKFANKNDVDSLMAKSICEHYNLLYKNYEACRGLYDNKCCEPKNNRAFKVIRKKTLEKLDELDVTKSSFRLVDHTDKDDLFAN